MDTRIIALTAVSGQDAQWVPKYLAEAERLGLMFGVLLDRCDVANTIWGKLIGHSLCRFAIGKGTEEFTEQHKQPLWDAARARDYKWAIAWDIDETWGRNAMAKIEQTLSTTNAHVLTARWLNLWETPDQVRWDGAFRNGCHAKFYNLAAGPWKFDHPITNGCKLLDARGRIREDTITGKTDIVCLHHGMMTKELRQFHKDRWDRIYSAAVGCNPYGFWNYALDESVTVETVSNSWKP